MKKIPFKIIVELDSLGIDYTKVKYLGHTNESIILETKNGKQWYIKR